MARSKINPVPTSPQTPSHPVNNLATQVGNSRNKKTVRSGFTAHHRVNSSKHLQDANREPDHVHKHSQDASRAPEEHSSTPTSTPSSVQDRLPPPDLPHMTTTRPPEVLGAHRVHGSATLLKPTLALNTVGAQGTPLYDPLTPTRLPQATPRPHRLPLRPQKVQTGRSASTRQPWPFTTRLTVCVPTSPPRTPTNCSASKTSTKCSSTLGTTTAPSAMTAMC